MVQPDIEAGADGAEPSRGRPRLPRTDLGTFLLHWSMAIAMVLAMITGFRIAWDGANAVFSRLVAPILLQGDVWTIHFYAALTMFGLASAYLVYLNRTALTGRNALARLRLLVVEAPARLKWQAFNVSMHWGFYLLTLAMMATGILLYLGWGGLVVDIHAALAIALVAYLVIHIVGHFMQGGWQQLLRIFLPARLVAGPLAKPRPLLAALAIGAIASIAIAAMDLGTRDRLVAPKIAVAPVLDGELDDPAWKGMVPARVRTQQGFNLAGGRGESLVEIRAAHDGDTIYFAFRWQDPTRSLKRLPVIKRADGWHLLHNHADIADESAYYEDKFAVLFARTDAFGGGVTHLGPKPLDTLPGALNGRGLHYTTDGSYADMWQWKASRGGHLGKVDDMHFGPPYPANARQQAGTERYSAGYLQDPGKAFYAYNYKGEPPGGYRGPVTVPRLPKDYRAIVARMGTINLDVNVSDDEGAQWWMFEAETLPYSAELDAAIPVGTVLPGVIIGGTYEGDRADVSAAPKWKDGWWTLEAKRSLKGSGSKFDIDFTEGKPVYLWVSVFDHNQTRHTRHVRGVRLDIR
ncbi:MAG: ethylbenzene dehydrogenase-related protein [Hyphomicrobiales bacterium]|nr:ethylbenzene dehydrogenase-related protein [Hyphomicrobiales bacterium]MCA1999669.1 ethylbenzene dehydrogenase-related protein [Hyphomicrobiales bacterium]